MDQSPIAEPIGRAAAAQAMPISCATAPGDLHVLLVTGTEKTKYEVTTGEYNAALDTKIGQIKAACRGVQAD
jgi:hypothetical protein